MKTTKIYAVQGKRKRAQKKPLLRAKAFLAMAALACGIGIYTGCQIARADTATIKSDDSRIVTVEDGQTVWDIARPVAGQEGQDIREVVYEIQINNDLDDNCTVRPGQKLIVRF